MTSEERPTVDRSVTLFEIIQPSKPNKQRAKKVQEFLNHRAAEELDQIPLV